MMKQLRTWLVRRMLARLKTPRDAARMAFVRYAERVAVIDSRRSVTYAKLGQRCFSIAAAWRGLGLKPGDVVAVQLPDGISQIEARLAAAEHGAVLTLLPVWQTPEQAAQAVAAIEARLFIHGDANGATARLLRERQPQLRQLELGGDAEGWLGSAPARPSPDAIDPQATCSMGFTSGTTGQPKVLTATHAIYMASLRMMVANVDFGPPSASPAAATPAGPARMLVGIPLTGAGSGVVLPTLLSGGTLVIPPRHDAATLLAGIERHRATRLFTTPSLLIDMLDHEALARTDLSSLANIIYGTETLAVPKLEEALRRFGPILQQGYGSAEVLPPVSMLQPHQHFHDGRPAAREILMSCGRVVPGVTVRIVDEAGQDLPPGEPGNVLIGSPLVFGGYWRRDDLSAQALSNGFLRIGDMGRLSADGHLTVLGRKPDLVSRGGRTIFPRMVEEAVHDHPAVKEAALVQGPQGAVLVFSLRRALRGRHALAHWRALLVRHLAEQIPDWQMPDHYHLLDDLPRSPLGKVLRREVRELLAAGARAEAATSRAAA